MSADPDLALVDPAAAGTGPRQHRWERICATGALSLDRGAAAMVDGTQIAIFLLANGDLFAIDDHDPFSGADVLSRGLVGDVAGEPTVASPVYKQRFALRTGHCLDDPTASVRTWVARIRDRHIEVAVL